MADFCLQCSALMFGPEVGNDLSGISTPEDTAAKLYANVLCEGCGMTQVDHTGRCIHHTDSQHEDAILRGIVPD
jgi:hypothetical protein